MRLIDANALLDKQESLYMKGNVLFHGITACAIENAPTIDPESLPIVQELRAELTSCKQELWQIKYCYDIAKNGEKQFRKQNDEITAAWAECAKKLKQVTAERDAAVKNRAKLAEYELTVCEEFCYGDAQHDIPPCEWLIGGKCALREWVKEYA